MRMRLPALRHGNPSQFVHRLATSTATWALACLLGASLVCAAQNQPGKTEPGAADSSLYVKLQLDNSVKVSGLKPGEVVEGTLSQDVYSRDRKLFPAGIRVRLTVDKLERRRRAPNDHWPWVIRVFAPRHENYPSFRSARLSLAGGTEIPLRVSWVSIGRKMEVRTKPDKPHQTAAPATAQAEAASPASLQVEFGKQATGPTVTLTAAGLTAAELAATPSAEPVSREPELSGPTTLATGTRAKVILLNPLSASKSRAGDSFRARLVEPVRVGSSAVLPEGSVFEGTVAKSTPPRWLSRAGSLGLRFTHLTVPGGGGAPIVASFAGAELDRGSRTKLDSEGQLKGDRPGKAWMAANLGVTFGIAKAVDDGTQLAIEAIASTATDASTAGTGRIVALCVSSVFLVTRHGRDVVLPKYTEMEITFDRPVVVPGLGAGPGSQ